MAQSKAELLVSKAVLQMLYKAPFYGMLAMQLEWISDPVLNPPTMGTNGFNVRYHTGHVLEYPFKLLVSECKHEIGHIAYRHLIDRGTRDPELWNMAGDYRINADLVMNGDPIGDDWLYDPKYNDWTTVEIYNDLKKQQQQNRRKPDGKTKSGGGNGKKCDGYHEPNSHTEHTKQEVENHIQGAIIQAMQTAKMSGKLPAGLERQLNMLLYPPVDWLNETRHFLEEVCKTDYSWAWPNRRYMSTGFYLPSLHTQEHKPIVIGIDTSGSIGQGELLNFLGGVNDILEQVRPPEVWVLAIDAELHQVIKYELNDLPLKPVALKGGGGTSFVPLFDWIAKSNIEISGAIYLTDLYGDQNSIKEPDYPVLWASTTKNLQGPFGNTVHVQIAQ